VNGSGSSCCRLMIARFRREAVEESQRPAPGDRRALGMEARPLVAMEAVTGGIKVKFAIGSLGADRLDVRHRDALVLFAEMHLRGAARLLVGGFGDLAAVEAHG